MSDSTAGLRVAANDLGFHPDMSTTRVKRAADVPIAVTVAMALALIVACSAVILSKRATDDRERVLRLAGTATVLADPEFEQSTY